MIHTGGQHCWKKSVFTLNSPSRNNIHSLQSSQWEDGVDASSHTFLQDAWLLFVKLSPFHVVLSLQHTICWADV